MRRFAELLILLRWPTLLVLLTGVAISALVLPKTEFSLSIQPLIEGGEAAQAREREFQREIPPQIYDHLVFVTWPRQIGTAELAALSMLHRSIREDPRVHRVVSIAEVPVLGPNDILPRTFRSLVGDGDVLTAAKAQPLFYRWLISADGHSATLALRGSRPKPGQTLATAKSELLDWLATFIPEQLAEPVEVRFVSGFVAERARRSYMEGDLVRIVSLELLLAAILLPFVFRSVRGVVLPLAAVVVAVLFNFGLLYWCGGTLGVIELAIPGLIIMIGLSDAVHMIHRYEEERAEGIPHAQAIPKMTSRVGTACLLTSLTTAIGFLSLLIASHSAVREFGLKAAAAVMVTFLATLLVIPLGLTFFRSAPPRVPRLPWIHRLSYGRGRLVMMICTAVGLLAVIGLTRIQIEARWLEELPPEDPIRAHVQFVEEQFSGVLEIDAAVRGDLGTAAGIQSLEKFQDEIAQAPGVLRVESITHWLRAALGNPEGPLTDAQVTKARSRLRLAGKAFFPSHLVTANYGRGRIVFRTPNLPSGEFLAIRDRIRDTPVGAGLAVEPRGYALMAQENALLVSETLLESLALSMVAITLLIMILYRSWRLGILSVLPNFLPVLLALGVNGWLGIPLRLGIVMIYSLGLGVAVDDTIHLLTRYQQERRDHPDAAPGEWVLRSLRSAGAALVVTSVILVLGGLCFLPADFRSIHDVGLLLSVIVIAALACDLFVLPLLLERFANPKPPPESTTRPSSGD